MNENSQQLLTPAEVAEELRVQKRTVLKLINDGTLPCLDLGHRTKRIRRDDLDAYLLKAREGAACN